MWIIVEKEVQISGDYENGLFVPNGNRQTIATAIPLIGSVIKVEVTTQMGGTSVFIVLNQGAGEKIKLTETIEYEKANLILHEIVRLASIIPDAGHPSSIKIVKINDDYKVGRSNFKVKP